MERGRVGTPDPAGASTHGERRAGKIHTPLGSWYHATKHAPAGWSDCLRYELAPFGIDVIVIEPGSVRTEFGEVGRSMLERSRSSAYADMANKMADAVRTSSEQGAGSPPSALPTS